MAHECPECGQVCYCDGEDTWMDTWATAAECIHVCGPEHDDGCDEELPEAQG